MYIRNLIFPCIAYTLLLICILSLSACSKSDVDEEVETVTVSEVDALISELDEFLETATPISNQEFEKKYVKNLTPEEEIIKLRHAHDLVAAAVDPDPDWFSTFVDKSMFVTQQGAEHDITLTKRDLDGNTLGPVNNELLRLVVRIQRSEHDFEYVTNVNIDNYAKWIGPGKLKIKVPDNLTQGRLMVGVRPNFEDVGQAAIAERWSTYILAEVWQLKQNVKNVDSATVMFPIINDKTVSVSVESQFSREEIADVTSKRFTNDSSLELPIVLRTNDLTQGDLLAYTLQGKPYSGRVTSLEQKGDQYLALLAPEIFEVYDVTDADDGFLIKEGVFPEHVIYREGEALASSIDQSDPVSFKQGKGLLSKLFSAECSIGGALVTFKVNTDYINKNIGLDMKIHLGPDEIECIWKSTAIEVSILNAFAAAGPALLVTKIFGSDVTISPLGELKIAANLPSLGLELGGSIQQGGYVKMGLQDAVKLTSFRDLSLPDETYVQEVEVSAALGIALEVDLLSDDGGLSLVMGFLRIDLTELGIEGKGGIKGAIITQLPRASTVYNSGAPASVALKLLSFAELKLLDETSRLFKYFGIEILKYQEEALLLPEMKTEPAFTYNKVFDRPTETTGRAKLFGLSLSSSLLEAISPFTSVGVLGPKDKTSSVFNDFSEDIEYELKECSKADPSTRSIKSPAYACSGPFCGKVEKTVELCNGELNITSVVATARVEEDAAAIGTVSNYSQEAVDALVSASGERNSLALTHYLTPSEVLSADGGSAEVEFSQTCPKSPGVYRGSVKVKGEVAGEIIEDTEKSYLVCSKDDNRGDPHIVTADGMGYDYYASGDYILSRVNGVTGYQVQARFLPGFETSWPQAVSLQVGNDVVEIQGRKTDGHNDGTGVPINALSIWINGQQSHLGTSSTWTWGYDTSVNRISTLPSGGILAVPTTTSSNVFTFPSSVVVIWPEGSQTESYGVILRVQPTGSPFVQIQIARPDTFSGQERGLMGNNDGDPSNDFIRRNGQILGQESSLSFSELYGLFGTDWLVKPHESLFRNPEAIKPEFPSDVVTLTPIQRDFGEEACRGLTGFYREACILDVGLSGSVDLVKEYYSNTDDLNSISDSIITPSIDSPRYELQVGEPVYSLASQLSLKQQVNVTHLSGQGKFVLLVRPPKGAWATLSNEHQSYFGEGDFNTEVRISCNEVNTATDNVFFNVEGALQLWIQDPLSGAATRMVSEVPLSCGLVKAGEDISKTFGEVSAYTQAATVDGNTVGDVTYSSSNTSVATVQPQSGRVFIKGVGSTTITAILKEKGDFGLCGDVNTPKVCKVLGKDSYVLTVEKGSPVLSLGQNLVLDNNSEAFNRPVNSTFSSNTVYQSSNTDIATVDELGKVTLTGGIGETTITATFSENDLYLAAEESYDINVQQFVEVISSNSEITIQWASAPNVTSYNLYYAAESFSSLQSLSDYIALDEGQLIQDITGVKYVLNNLDREKMYYFVLVGIANGEMFQSSEMSARLLQNSDVKYVFAASEANLVPTINDSVENFEPWVTDGTVLGTRKIKELSTSGSSISSFNKEVRYFDGNFYFSVATPQNEGIFSRTSDGIGSLPGLWRTDGSELGTERVEGLSSEYTSINMDRALVLPEYLIFYATSSSGTTMLTLDKNDVINEVGNFFPSDYAVFDNKFVFNAYSDEANGFVVHEFSNGVISAIEWAVGSYIREAKLLANTGEGLFYVTPGIEDVSKTLWVAKNGEAPLALMEFQTDGIPSSYSTNQMLSFNSKLYFIAEDTSGSALWVSDGTVNGTNKIKSFGFDTMAKELHVVGDKILFQVAMDSDSTADANVVEGIWSSDGTTGGTFRVKSLPLKSFYEDDELYNAAVTSSDHYYFILKDNSLGVSDGTEVGTRVVLPASSSTEVQNLVSHKQVVFFELSRGSENFTLWRSDGTDGGTFSLGGGIMTSYYFYGE